MKVSLYILLLIIFFYAKPVIAQEVQSTTEQKLEDLSEASDEQIEDDSYLQNLDYYKRHPLNLNTASKEELQTFKFITDLQIDHLLQHRQLLGSFIDIYELQAIPTWDINTIKRILPFVTIASPNISLQPILAKFSGGNYTLLIRESKVLEKAKGYLTELPTHYLGGNDHLFIRYKYQYSNFLQYGFVADKDAGEPLFKQTASKGFDFYTAHLFARNTGAIKTLAIGDFTVNMGQGLIQWQTLAFNKSADVMAVKRQSAVLMPYSSSGEAIFHRGIGATFNKRNVEATAFASYKKISANTILDTLTHQEIVSSFLTSGLHRTFSEIKDKNSVGQTSIGGNVTYLHNNFKIGINAISYYFSGYLQKRDEPYNLFAIVGKQWSNMSLDYSYTYKNMHLFGEAAADKRLNKAFLSGVLISAAQNVDLSLLYRKISKSYQSLYSNAFTENSMPSNESGMYIGISIRPLTGWKIDAYADYYQFPWLKYRVDAPSNGQDYLLQATYRPNKKLELYIRYKTSNKPLNERDTSLTNYVTLKYKQNWRANMSYSFSKKFLLHNRIEMVGYNKKEKDAERGFLAFAEGSYKPGLKLSANVRLQYFKTDGYNSRIYAYESDVLYSYSIPAFFDNGFRYYLNINYDASKKLSVWLRWAQSVYTDKESMGSGLDEIQGNKRTEVKLQLKFTF